MSILCSVCTTFFFIAGPIKSDPWQSYSIEIDLIFQKLIQQRNTTPNQHSRISINRKPIPSVWTWQIYEIPKWNEICPQAEFHAKQQLHNCPLRSVFFLLVFWLFGYSIKVETREREEKKRRKKKSQPK